MVRPCRFFLPFRTCAVSPLLLGPLRALARTDFCPSRLIPFYWQREREREIFGSPPTIGTSAFSPAKDLNSCPAARTISRALLWFAAFLSLLVFPFCPRDTTRDTNIPLGRTENTHVKQSMRERERREREREPSNGQRFRFNPICQTSPARSAPVAD